MGRNVSSDDVDLSRRTFMSAAAAGLAAINLAADGAGAAALSGGGKAQAALAEAIGKLEYLTPPEQFFRFAREKPRVFDLPAQKLREVGLHPDTWQLEVVPDPVSDCKVERPLSRENGTAFTWRDLMKLGETRAVRYLKAMTCTNVAEPFGMGLWEGVPLREIIWLARPTANVRRVYQYGYHNDDARQRFQSSLSINRILEDPPGGLPVILCYKVNGQFLSPKAGGPVRLIVPEDYGNRSIKWLQRIVLTNSYQSNDTYATWNNDIDSTLKTYARFLKPPTKAKAGEPLAIVGAAQVGISGLSRVQYAIHPTAAPLPADDPYLTKLHWRDAQILPPPERWGGGLPDDRLPPIPLQFGPDGKPKSWPLKFTLVHWAAVLTDLRAGSYELRCRAIDDNGIAQPLPRPMLKSGNNAIQRVALTVDA